MKFINLPRIVVERQELHDKPYVLISITESPKDIISHEYPNCVDLMRLHFDDIKEPVEDFVVFSEEMAKQVCDFVAKHQDKEVIFIHCTMGISRSAGVAAALNKFYNGDDMLYFNKYRPNILCYRLVLNQLQGESKWQPTPNCQKNSTCPTPPTGNSQTEKTTSLRFPLS